MEKECKHTGIETWGKNRRALRGKLSKDEIISGISEKLGSHKLELQPLTVKDLTSILQTNIKLGVVKCPEASRFKAPYIESLIKVFPEVSGFNKLSVLSLKSLILALEKLGNKIDQ